MANDINEQAAEHIHEILRLMLDIKGVNLAEFRYNILKLVKQGQVLQPKLFRVGNVIQ